jgi:hypothetical protein
LPLIRWLSAVWVVRSRAVQQAFDTLPPESRLLVRYETLREQTAETLRAVCEMLGLQAARATEIANRHRFERVPVRERGPRREVRAARPGSWRENLSPAEQAAMHEALGPALEEFGYEGDPIDSPAIAAS